MKPAYRITALAALIALTACGGGYDRGLGAPLNAPQAIGSPFSRYMAHEYRELSRSMNTGLVSRMLGAVDARQHFARKADAAADGVIVMPEMAGDWALNGADFAEISEARATLMGMLDSGGRDLRPDKAAFAQASFDCWASGQERMRGGESSCKRAFRKTMRELQYSVGLLPVAAAPPAYSSSTAVGSTSEEFPPPITAASVAAATAGGLPGTGAASGSSSAAGGEAGGKAGGKGGLSPAQQAMFLVFFDWNRHSLTGKANDVLDAIAEELKLRQDLKKVVVVGHADTSGEAKYNRQLSLLRAQAVRDALAARGASKDKINAEGRGEDDLLVKTPDNVREPGNRRAQITLE